MKRIRILDRIPFDRITAPQLIHRIMDASRNNIKCRVCYMNTQGATEYIRNKEYADAMEKCLIIHPDGWGPVIASRFSDTPLPERSNVGDFMPSLLKRANRERKSIFLLGCEEGVAEKTATEIRKQYPAIRIAGYHSGFFDREAETAVCRKITTAKPDLVLVGMGAPRQELFIERNWNRLPNAVYMGIGGVFYYITGLKSRAPVFMRQSGMEWLYRLLQEPQRLWRRYTLDTWYFMFLFLRWRVTKTNRRWRVNR